MSKAVETLCTSFTTIFFNCRLYLFSENHHFATRIMLCAMFITLQTFEHFVSLELIAIQSMRRALVVKDVLCYEESASIESYCEKNKYGGRQGILSVTQIQSTLITY